MGRGGREKTKDAPGCIRKVELLATRVRAIEPPEGRTS